MSIRHPHTHATVAVTWMDGTGCHTAHYATPIAAQRFAAGLAAKGVTADKTITWDGAEVPDRCECEEAA